MPYVISPTFENSSGVATAPSQMDGSWNEDDIYDIKLKFTDIVKQTLATTISFQTDLSYIVGDSNSRIYETEVVISDNNNLGNAATVIQLADQNLSGTQKMTVSFNTGLLSTSNYTVIVKANISID
jgi:hypothetical protein